MTTSPPPSDPSQQFEDLLARALDALEQGGQAAVEALLAASPQQATRLRQHLQRLDHLGLMATPTDTETAAGVMPERLGDFRLLQRLGQGGMGVVYLAEQESLGRRVALKLIRPEHNLFDGSRQRFRREVEAVARLQHPGIVPVYATGEDNGVPWLAMEHVRGASLDQVVSSLAGSPPEKLRGSDLLAAVAAIAAPGSPPPDDRHFATSTWVDACLRLVRQVASALHHAHLCGVLHRDVKPSNIMLTLDGRPLLLDFGLARTELSPRLTVSGGVLGSPAYMSPEQMRGEHDRIDARTDVYALGVTLIELLTLESPFAGDSAEATRTRVLAGTLPPLHRRNPAIARDVEIVCRKATDAEAGHRYADAAAFAEDLDNLLALRPVRAVPPSTLTVVRRWTQRHPARAIGLAAAFLLLCVAPTLFLLQQWAANESIRAALERARRDRDRAIEAVRTMLVQVAGEDLLNVPLMQHIRRNLLAKARGLHEQFLADSADDPAMLDQAAGSAHELALVDAESGQLELALASARRAVRLARDRIQREDTPAARRQLAEVLSLQGRAELAMSRSEAAEPLLDEARRTLDTLPSTGDGGTRVLIERMAVLRGQALLYSQVGRYDEATRARQEVLKVWSELEPAVRGDESWRTAFDQAFCTLADQIWTEMNTRHWDTVSALLERADRMRSQVELATMPTSTQHAATRLEMVRARQPDQDVAAIEGALEAARLLLQPSLRINPEDALAIRLEAGVLNSLALLRRATERKAEATACMQQSIDRLQRLTELDPEVIENRANLAVNLVNLGAWRQEDGELDAALALFERARGLLVLARASAPDRPDWLLAEYNATWFLAQVHGERHDPVAQAEMAARLVTLRPDDHKTLRIAAGLTATAIADLPQHAPAVADRPARQRELEQRALAWLRDAARLGNTDHDWLANGPEFAPLRRCEGFADILRDVAANQARAAGGR
ncbi:MAG: serine/threonine protein kinase [Planctomycetes bacterium]|nr:serine/threonine protein kinase [Planctomycetota bacterium]